MSERELKAMPINAEEFAAFGEIIDKHPSSQIDINEGRFDRYQELATVDTADQDGHVNISIFHCRAATALPFEIKMMERHPLGSQAFIPLSNFQFNVVVAPRGETADVSGLRAFRTNGDQGVNLHRGVWHLPMIGEEIGQEFLVVDRGGGGNYDEYYLPTQIVLVAN